MNILVQLKKEEVLDLISEENTDLYYEEGYALVPLDEMESSVSNTDFNNFYLMMEECEYKKMNNKEVEE